VRANSFHWVFPALKHRAESCSPCGAKTIRISPDLRSAYGVNSGLRGPLRRIHGAIHIQIAGLDRQIFFTRLQMT
jgi:hypothetical protein